MEVNVICDGDISKLCLCCLSQSNNMRHIHEKVTNKDTMFSIIQNNTTLKIENSVMLKIMPKYICRVCEMQILEILKFKKKVDQTKIYLDNYVSAITKVDSLKNGKCVNAEIGAKINGQKEEEEEDVDIYADLDDDEEEKDDSTEANVKKENPKFQSTPLKEENGIAEMKDTKETEINQSKNQEKWKKAVNESINLCGQSFTNYKEMVDDKESFKIKTDITCSRCNKEVPYKEFEEHLMTHPSNLRCSICSMKFFTQRNLERHKAMHNFKSRSSLVSDMLCIKKTCHLCQKVFNSSTKLALHMAVHQNTSSSSSSNYCQVCDKHFNSYLDLKTHSVIHTNRKQFIRNVTTSTQKQATYTCKTCFKTFSKQINLRLHEVTHLNENLDEKLYKCDVCDRQFSLKPLLIAHKQSKHTNLMMHKCPVCQEKFPDRIAWSQHLATHL